MAIKDETFISYRGTGKQGLNTLADPQDIQPTEVADCNNVIFDSGYAEPRKGSTLAWTKPEGETNDLLALFAGRDSLGRNFPIAVYAPNFYLRDKLNNQWVKINQSYTPSSTYKTLMYSYKNWNEGLTKDRMYIGNGTESTIKWQIGVGYVVGATAAAATTLALVDASNFPASGTVIVKDPAQAEFTVAYTSKTSNTLNLAATLGTACAANSCVAFPIEEKASMPKGKLIESFQGRLVIASSAGFESLLNYSLVSYPEDFTTATGAAGAGSRNITDGNGGLISVKDFGTYLVALKSDSTYKVDFVLNSTVDGKYVQVLPLVNDVSMGPVSSWSVIKKNNALFYPTPSEGVFKLNPDQTGANSTTGVSILSMDIQPLAISLDYTNSRVSSIHQKVFWSCQSLQMADTVLVYDTLRDLWTRFDNWNVKDWLVDEHVLYYGNRTDNNIYETLSDSYADDEKQYISYVVTKRYDFDKPSEIKTCDFIYLQGYISAPTILDIEVYLNENGSLLTIPYQIKGTSPYVAQPMSEAMAMAMLGVPIMGMGSTLDLDSIGIFATYLAIPRKYGFHVIQVKVLSNQAGARWGLTGIGFAPDLVTKVPAQLVIGSIADPTNAV